MKNFKIPFLGIMSLVLIASCTKSEDDIGVLKLESTEDQKILRETSILFGKLISNNEVKKDVLSKMKQIEQDGDMVSFAFLLDEKEKLKKDEIKAIQFLNKSKDSKNIFKNALFEEFKNNQELYTSLSKNLVIDTDLVKKSTPSSIADDLAKLLVDKELQIFYPSDEDFENNTNAVNQYYVSYDPLNGSKTNESFQFKSNSERYIIKENINNDFIDDNPVFIIAPIDDCDLPGRPCDWDDGDPISDLPPYTGSPKLLTYNVNHNLVPENDIISARIPAIRVNGTRWMRFGGTHLKLSFLRGSPDGTIIREKGILVAGAKAFPVKKIRIKRKYLKRKLRWVTFNAEFDPDWNMSENTQVMAVFSRHHWLGSGETTVSVKSGLKIDAQGNVKPTTEVTTSTKVTLREDNAKYRTKSEMSRRFILSTIVGNGITGKTKSDNGVSYNMKRVDIVDYYMKFWHTDLTP